MSRYTHSVVSASNLLCVEFLTVWLLWNFFDVLTLLFVPGMASGLWKCLSPTFRKTVSLEWFYNIVRFNNTEAPSAGPDRAWLPNACVTLGLSTMWLLARAFSCDKTGYFGNFAILTDTDFIQLIHWTLIHASLCPCHFFAGFITRGSCLNIAMALLIFEFGKYHSVFDVWCVWLNY